MKMTFGMRVLSSLFVVVFMFTVGVDEALAYPGECTICVDNSVPEIIFVKSQGQFDTTLHLRHYKDDTKVKIYWYAINALDVYTTYRGLRSNDSLIELNPLLPKRPSLAQLVLHKTLLLTVYHHRFEFTQKDYRYLNTVFTGAVINNYSLYK
jgi:hypothetical protein